MKSILAYLYYLILSFALSLRYKIEVRGFKEVKKAHFNKKKGILFLANHPAEVDPCILLKILWPHFRPRPVASEMIYHSSIIRYLLNFVGTLPIPSFEHSTNSYKKRRVEKLYEKIFDLLRNRKNILIYPGGGLKRQAKEIIGGASGVYTILQQMPDVNVVLIRTRGLWGSSFSRAQTGKSPDVLTAFLRGVVVLLKNGIFFAPRRRVSVECVLAPSDLPRTGSKLELNRYLENWYNAGRVETLKLVSYSFWKKDIPKVVRAKKILELSVQRVPKEIQDQLLDELSQLTHIPRDKIKPEMDLAVDLGLDSLDLSQLLLVLKDHFGVSSVSPSEITTVGSLMLFASHLKESDRAEIDEPEWGENKWRKETNRPAAKKPLGKNIVEAFFHTADRMGRHFACADLVSGEVNYLKLKRVIIALAYEFRKLPGHKIGIMLPASIGANVSVLAILLAGKIPVMINWTLGARNMESVVAQTKIQATLTSWSFIDRLENAQLDGIDDQIVLLDDVRRKMNLKSKLKAFFFSHLPAKFVLSAFKNKKIIQNDPAVILFTSGTESLPKGVPLSHKNILKNQEGAISQVDISDADVLLGFLPPFHSFGFSVTGLMPLLYGMRVVFSPNPIDGRKIVSALERWQATICCTAPTFLKSVLRNARAEQLRTLRLVVVGAEATSSEIYEKLATLNPSAKILEGYGITECGPILTLNPYHGKSKGVGKALPEVSLKIVHPETHEELDFEKSGLILAAGPNIFRGYLDPSLTSPFVELEGKYWYNTGDLGKLDSEGYLILEGRLKRFVKIGGEMVSLTAIETALLEVAYRDKWPLDPEIPSLAICALEESGKKTEIHLVTTFPLTRAIANEALKKSGMSNLIKITSVLQLPFMPLLGSGKINYRALNEKLQSKNKDVSI